MKGIISTLKVNVLDSPAVATEQKPPYSLSEFNNSITPDVSGRTPLHI